MLLLTGGTGLVGSAIRERLAISGQDFVAPTRHQMNLLDPDSVRSTLAHFKPNVVVAAAALVGGIAANIAAPVKFLTENLQMQSNLIIESARVGVEQIIFLGSSCIYPRDCSQPMHESMLMSGKLEPTNESYAIAKLAGIQLCRAVKQEFGVRFVVPIPSNIYGKADHFEPNRAHMLSALVAKFCQAKDSGASEVDVWGSGNARRELTHADDLADAICFILDHKDIPELINVGTGTDHAIHEISSLLAMKIGYRGRINFDKSKPEGMPRKVLDVSVMASFGWRSSIPLERGIDDLIAEFRIRNQ